MRIRQLDVLRGLAILLVLGRHKYVNDLWMQAGWAGVDLFFVLSGFLIAGLLFVEYRRFGSLDRKQFFIRRAFKIYPMFYFILLVKLVLDWRGGTLDPPRRVAAEVLFVQNYFPPLWNHTWSLAVEEHFYLILPTLLVALIAWNRRSEPTENPFRVLPQVFLVVALVILGFRVLTTLFVPYNPQFSITATHLRIDSLFLGVLLAYYHHFHGPALTAWVRARGPWLPLVSGLLLVPLALFKIDSAFMRTIGFSLVGLGFAGWLLWTVYNPPKLRAGWQRPLAWGMSGLAWIGTYSYGIYLWHVVFVEKGLQPLYAIFGKNLPAPVEFAVYAVAAVTAGFVATQLIERPALALRNRYFPARSGATPATPPLPAVNVEGAAP